MDDLAQIRARAQMLASERNKAEMAGTPRKPAPTGVKGALINFLPTVASGAGAVLGGAAGGVGGFFGGAGIGAVPGTAVGAAAGGAAGGAIGEYLRQRLTGEADDGIDKGNLIQEGAFGALPGVLKGVKAVKAARVGAQAVDAGMDVAKATKAVQSTEGALLARKGMLGNIADKASDVRSSVSGTTVGTVIEKGKRVTPAIESKVTSYLDDTLKAAGTPKDKLVKVIADKEEVGSMLQKIADSDKKPLNVAELERVFSKTKPTLLSKDTELTSAARKAIAESKTKGDLYKVEKMIDSELTNYYNKIAGGTGTKAEEQILSGYRKGIKDVLDDIPGMKDAKDRFATATTAEKLLLKAPKARNFNIFGVDTGIGGAGAQKAKDKIGQLAQKVASSGTPSAVAEPASGFAPFLGATAKASVPQAGYRAAGAMAGIPFVGSEPSTAQPLAPQDALSYEQDIIAPTETAPTTSGGIFSDQAKVEQAYLTALQSGDSKTADAILKAYSAFGKTGGATKTKSAEAKKTESNAIAGLEAINDLRNTIAKDPSALTKTAIPGRGVFSSVLGSALGTGEIDASRQQVIDIIARLRTGAAISATEEARFQKFIPQAFDTPEVQAQKLGYLERQFQRVAERGTAGTDLESAAGL